MFHTLNKNHNYNTRVANSCQLGLPPSRTTLYKTYSFRMKATKPWNKIQEMSIPNLIVNFQTLKKTYYGFATTNIIANISTKYLSKKFILNSYLICVFSYHFYLKLPSLLFASIMVLVLFTVFKNSFHTETEFSAVHLFADDKNLVLSDYSLKKLNKHINRELENECICANKLSLFSLLLLSLSLLLLLPLLLL